MFVCQQWYVQMPTSSPVLKLLDSQGYLWLSYGPAIFFIIESIQGNTVDWYLELNYPWKEGWTNFKGKIPFSSKMTFVL